MPHIVRTWSGRLALAFFLFCVLLAVWLVLIVHEAQAHSWYTGMQNPKTKSDCCGGSDCAQLPDGAARAVKGGYMVDHLPQGFPNAGQLVLPAFVPNDETQPGMDPTHYHMCIWGQHIQCFFVPAPGI